MLEFEARTKILKPEQNQDCQHGQHDEAGSEDFVCARRSLHHLR